MKRDSLLFGVLHVLLHMVEQPGPRTSKALARAMNTNPVVVRRIMAGLRDRGFVRSEKGPGGGWTIAQLLSKITFRDIYAGLGRLEVLAMGNRTEAPGCLVEQSVNASLGEAFDAAKAMLLRRFAEINLAQLSADFHARLGERSNAATLENSHAA